MAVKSATSKNGIVTFSDVQNATVYVSAAYDPSGAWDAQSGPPPKGSSLGMHSKAPPKPDPINIAPGKIAKATISFDDKTKVQETETHLGKQGMALRYAVRRYLISIISFSFDLTAASSLAM
jgi:hypothetical protein